MISTLSLFTSCIDQKAKLPNKHRGNPNLQKLLTEGDDVAQYTASQALRDTDLADSEDILSYYHELSLNAEGKMPAYYRTIPEVANDHDGRNQSITRPSSFCGVTQDSIPKKISDCLNKNIHAAYPKGKSFGRAGEGNWKLVTYFEDDPNSSTYQVWIDLRTKMLWSDKITASNWCKASGNQETNTIDCNDIGDNENICNTDSLGALSKGNLDLKVQWRLPTRGDFLQADLNGARSILNSSESDEFWTATPDQVATQNAWAIKGKTGVLRSVSRDSSIQIRCIGRML
ncbi:MAG: hypothetical protein ACI9QD_000286 [Thermoproteota archaeon]|jgi:hypothetical protein